MPKIKSFKANAFKDIVLEVPGLKSHLHAAESNFLFGDQGSKMEDTASNAFPNLMQGALEPHMGARSTDGKSGAFDKRHKSVVPRYVQAYKDKSRFLSPSLMDINIKDQVYKPAHGQRNLNNLSRNT